MLQEYKINKVCVDCYFIFLIYLEHMSVSLSTYLPTYQVAVCPMAQPSLWLVWYTAGGGGLVLFWSSGRIGGCAHFMQRLSIHLYLAVYLFGYLPTFLISVSLSMNQ